MFKNVVRAIVSAIVRAIVRATLREGEGKARGGKVRGGEGRGGKGKAREEGRERPQINYSQLTDKDASIR